MDGCYECNMHTSYCKPMILWLYNNSSVTFIQENIWLVIMFIIDTGWWLLCWPYQGRIQDFAMRGSKLTCTLYIVADKTPFLTDFCRGICRNSSSDVFCDAAVGIFANSYNFSKWRSKKGRNLLMLHCPAFYATTGAFLLPPVHCLCWITFTWNSSS